MPLAPVTMRGVIWTHRPDPCLENSMSDRAAVEAMTDLVLGTGLSN